MADNTIEYREIRAVNEEKALISAAKEDTEAFGKLYDRYYKDIFRYIYHRTFDHTLAEDLTSNTFFAALTHIHRYKWKRIPFDAWLYRIATNEIRMYYRKQRQVSEIDHQIPALSRAYDLSSDEEYAILHNAILRLNPIYQTVITLRFFEDKTIAEISQITRKKEGTIKSQLHRGLEQLQQILTKSGILSCEKVIKNG